MSEQDIFRTKFTWDPNSSLGDSMYWYIKGGCGIAKCLWRWGWYNRERSGSSQESTFALSPGYLRALQDLYLVVVCDMEH